MLISDSHRFLFVHVQKTGGSTIDNGLTAALGDVRRIPAANRHAPLDRLLQLEPGLATYWTAGFVRNPWARMLSWWRMMERFRDGADEGIERYVDHLQRNRFVASVIEKHPDFESFVMHAPDEHPRLRKPQVGLPQQRQRSGGLHRSPGESSRPTSNGSTTTSGLDWVGPRASTSTRAGRTTATSTPRRPGGGSPSSSSPTCASTATSSDPGRRGRLHLRTDLVAAASAADSAS